MRDISSRCRCKYFQICIAALVIDGKSLGEQNSVVEAMPLDLGEKVDIFERARGRKKKKERKTKEEKTEMLPY